MTPNHGLPLPGRSAGYLATLRFQPLADSDVHIWCLPLSGSVDELAHYQSILSADEMARVGRFRFQQDREHYIFGRGILRTLLGGYLQMDATRIKFIYGPYGKPRVESTFQNQTLQFNLAHSKDYAIYTFTWGRAIGVDLEHVHPLPEAEDLAERFFTPRENAWLNSFTGDKHTEAFFQLWTCKEAFLKAHGSGLTTPLNQVDVLIGGDSSIRILAIDSKLDSSSWRLEIFNPIHAYQAALALNGHMGDKLFFYIQRLEQI
jgi:4'-phosphopantetheinyl transferase